jgi:lysophospholipase L1-like esterase
MRAKYTINQEALNDLLEFNPESVFLCVGGNDITVDFCPREIFNNIITIVNILKNHGTKYIYVSEILTRGKFPKSPELTKQTFDKKRTLINKYLQKTYGHFFVTFPDIHFPNHYEDDQVHISCRRTVRQTHSSVPGMKKYQCRIVRVLCRH